MQVFFVAFSMGIIGGFIGFTIGMGVGQYLGIKHAEKEFSKRWGNRD